ncbi:hypothetical protein T02_16163 [Trichinella nativa]|uniref:Uncharacterized protein n=1 Tax=Trichinella nativa TaxID=6335 RepID=A0A0V1KSJ7_9BILA|nr:hypothetical protein T02_16163 [Trichinella nativa]
MVSSNRNSDRLGRVNTLRAVCTLTDQMTPSLPGRVAGASGASGSPLHMLFAQEEIRDTGKASAWISLILRFSASCHLHNDNDPPLFIPFLEDRALVSSLSSGESGAVVPLVFRLPKPHGSIPPELIPNELLQAATAAELVVRRQTMQSLGWFREVEDLLNQVRHDGLPSPRITLDPT